MKKLLTIAFILLSLSLSADSWTQKADFGGAPMQGGYGFSINGKGYIGKNIMWEFDPGTNAWTQKANYPGGNYNFPIYFTIGNKGYVGTGIYFPFTGPQTFSKLFYEYDPVANTWTQKADFGGGRRDGAVSFSVGAKGYAGMGDSLGYNQFTGDPWAVDLVDFWEYDPTLDLWTQKGDFPGVARIWAVGFTINTKGYVSTGLDTALSVNDLWEYEAANDTWLQKANYGGVPINAASGFSIGNKGYIGIGWIPFVGYGQQFWEYDQATDTWLQKANFGGGGRNYASAFSINGKGYIGVGANNQSGPVYKDFWEYTPDSSTTGINESNSNSGIKIFPTVTSGILNIWIQKNSIADEIINIYDIKGGQVKSLPFKNTVDVSDLNNGIFILQLQNINYTQRVVIQK